MPVGALSAQLDPDRGLDDKDAVRLAGLFRALADPSRVRILAAIRLRERCVHELVELLNMSQSAVSHQLRSLRDLHIVRRRRDGRHIYYRLDDAHVRGLFERALEHIEHA